MKLGMLSRILVAFVFIACSNPGESISDLNLRDSALIDTAWRNSEINYYQFNADGTGEMDFPRSASDTFVWSTSAGVLTVIWDTLPAGTDSSAYLLTGTSPDRILAIYDPVGETTTDFDESPFPHFTE